MVLATTKVAPGISRSSGFFVLSSSESCVDNLPLGGRVSAPPRGMHVGQVTGQTIMYPGKVYMGS